MPSLTSVTPDTAPTDNAPFSAQRDGDRVALRLQGDWRGAQSLPSADDLANAVAQAGEVRLSAEPNLRWDSAAMTRLYALARHCEKNDIALNTDALPEGMRRLLAVAMAVKPQTGRQSARRRGALDQLANALRDFRNSSFEFVEFVGGAALALAKFVTGRSNTRVRDIFYFMEQCGPQALGIVGLISVLVGMILAYLGSVQLRLFGAEVYVANLVALGMVREMGALMTAVIMSGRTGAAYAAQLGAMQSNEEVDAITTLGLSPMEYLVLPRLLALIAVMPLLCVFANVLGLAGGALVAAGMDVSFTQFVTQARESVSVGDVLSGLFKSLVFAALIATAGCQAGLRSGRSSAAVGQATTRAVVHAIVYLVIADAALNILYDKLGI